MGLVGGALVHGFLGFKNAAKGRKLFGAYQTALERSPILGGQFAAWGGMFSSTDCTLVAIRKKEDSWNPILAGGITGAALTVRAGPTAMVVSGIFGAAMLAMIEGVSMAMQKMQAPAFDPTLAPAVEDPSVLPSKPSSGGGSSGSVHSTDSIFGSTSSSSDGGASSFFGGTPKMQMSS